MAERKDYRTRQRDAVLGCFASHPREGLTAQEVYLRLSGSGTPIGRTTVYRTVALLCAQGALIALKDPRGRVSSPVRYQHWGDGHRHISVRCTGCGLIAALECSAVNAFEQHLLTDHGFLLTEAECLLPGLCSDCRPHDTM